MEYQILGVRREHKCDVQLVKAEVIDIKRKPNQIFTFKDASNFVESLLGNSNIAVYVGRQSADSESWVAYYWEPADPKKSGGYGERSYGSVLPLGSLAVLEMETEYDLEWELDKRAKECARWLSIVEEVAQLSKKIRKVDEDNKFADTEQFRFMNADELETTLKAMKEEYYRLGHRERVEVG